MNKTDSFKKELILALAEWLEEEEIDTTQYWDLLLFKCKSTVTVQNLDRETITVVKIFDRNYHDAAKKIDALATY